MRLRPVIAVLALVLATGACAAVNGSGDLVTIEVPIEDFSKLEVSHSFEVDVTVGEVPALTLTIDDNIEDVLDVGVTGDTLRIGLRGIALTNGTLRAELTVRSLESIKGSGAVNIDLGTMSGTSLAFELSGASDLDGEIEFDSISGEVSGASQLTLSGAVATVDLDANGASDLDLLALEVGELRIRVSGASNAEVTATESIDAHLSGASSLRYRGDPDVTALESSGASTISKIEG